MEGKTRSEWVRECVRPVVACRAQTWAHARSSLTNPAEGTATSRAVTRRPETAEHRLGNTNRLAARGQIPQRHFEAQKRCCAAGAMESCGRTRGDNSQPLPSRRCKAPGRSGSVVRCRADRNREGSGRGVCMVYSNLFIWPGTENWSHHLVTCVSPELGRFEFDQHHKRVPPPTLTTALAQGQFRSRSFTDSR